MLATDGNGHVVSGREEVAVQGLLCEGTLTGAYSVSADGTGTITLSQAFPLTSACVGTTTILKVAIAAGGEKFHRFCSNEAQLWLSVINYNVGNLW